MATTRDAADLGHDSPEVLELWARFHHAMAELPDREREVVNLLWYQGLTQKEAAIALGVSDRTGPWSPLSLALSSSLRNTALAVAPSYICLFGVRST